MNFRNLMKVDREHFN